MHSVMDGGSGSKEVVPERRLAVGGLVLVLYVVRHMDAIQEDELTLTC